MNAEARKGAMYNYINLLLIIVTSAVLTPFVIRSLGPSQYGLYTLMGGIIPYAMLLDLGLGKTITRYISYYRARNDVAGEQGFLATATRIYAVLVVVLLLVGACIYYHVDAIWGGHFTPAELADVRQMLLIIILTQVIIVPGNAYTAICYGCGYFAFPRGIQPVKYVLRALCVVALLLCGYKAVALIALEAVLNVLVVIATYRYVRRRNRGVTCAAPRRCSYRSVLSYASWIALYATTCALQWNVAQIVAGMTTDASTVGVVGIGVLLGTMYGYFAETINKMMMPQASKVIMNNPSGEELTDEMIRVGRIIAMILVGILGAFIIVGRSFVLLWAGEMYEMAYYIALIIMVSWTVQLTQDYGNALLEAKGSVRLMSIINFICIFVAAVFSYCAARQWGMIGMIGTLAIGTLLATVISNVYYNYKLRLKTARYFKCVYARYILILLASVVVAVVSDYYKMPVSWMWLLVQAVIYVVVYLLLVYFLLLTPAERKWLVKYAKR